MESDNSRNRSFLGVLAWSLVSPVRGCTSSTSGSMERGARGTAPA